MLVAGATVATLFLESLLCAAALLRPGRANIFLDIAVGSVRLRRHGRLRIAGQLERLFGDGPGTGARRRRRRLIRFNVDELTGTWSAALYVYRFAATTRLPGLEA